MHFENFLAFVKKEIDEDEPEGVRNNCRSEIKAFFTAESPESHIYRVQLLEAIRNKNPDEVLALIARGDKKNRKTLQNLNADCKAVALVRQKRRRDLICEEDSSQCRTDDQQPKEDQIEEEKQWIEILSNPLYISLEWFCRIYSDSTESATEASTSAVNEGSDEHEIRTIQQNENSLPPSDEGKENEDENQDVIATALRDSHLLEIIAGIDLHQHKQEYEERANEIEKFAVAVIKGSTRDQLIEIMDTKGDGCLKIDKPWNFSQSLSLLKIAADEKRKKVGEFLFVTAHACGNRAQSKL